MNLALTIVHKTKKTNKLYYTGDYSSNLSNEKFLGYFTEENCCKFPQGKQIQGNLTRFNESLIFSVVYVLFINRLKLLRFH